MPNWKGLSESDRVIQLEIEQYKLEDAIFSETGVEKDDFEQSLHGHLMLGETNDVNILRAVFEGYYSSLEEAFAFGRPAETPE